LFYSNVLFGDWRSDQWRRRDQRHGHGAQQQPIYTRSGTGDNVFDIPSYVTRLRITGSTSSSCQNFVVRVAGRLVVNDSGHVLGG
jgi:hypothetical protein